MSLTRFVALPDVKAKIKPFRPPPPRKISAALRVEPRTKRYTMIGTAFDYFLRFELQRRAPHAIAERWIAEYVPDKIWMKTGTAEFGTDFLLGVDPALYMEPEQVADYARGLLTEAKAAVAAYAATKTPDKNSHAKLASYAIRLAKLDPVFRAGRLAPDFRSADPADIEDLMELLTVVPFDEIVHPTIMRLNPNFGTTSPLVGGADTDLIAGDLMVDFKTTKIGETNTDNLDQLFGYFLLARKERSVNPTFPEIKRVGLYFCRHGYLFQFGISTWTNRAEFAEVEEWFFRRADEWVKEMKKAREQALEKLRQKWANAPLRIKEVVKTEKK